MQEPKKIIPIRDQITDQIRSDIIAGDLAPNSKLNEQSLASRFGVSRGPIRDVLLQLTKEGLLVAKSNCGVSVNSALTSGLQQLMMDIRTRIEIYAIENLKDKLTEQDFAALEDILGQFQSAFDNEQYTEVTKADIEFHRYLVERAGGEELVNLWRPNVMRMRMNYKRISLPEESVDEHKAILEALRSGNIDQAITALKANIR